MVERERFAQIYEFEHAISPTTSGNAVKLLVYMRFKSPGYIFYKKLTMPILGFSRHDWEKSIAELRQLGLVRYCSQKYGYELLPVDKLGGVYQILVEGGLPDSGRHTHIDGTYIDLKKTTTSINTAREALPKAAVVVSDEIFTQLNNKAKALGANMPQKIYEGIVTYTASFVDDKIEMLREEKAKRLIKNPSGWLAEAMKQDFQRLTIQDTESGVAGTSLLLASFEKHKLVVDEQRKSPCDAYLQLKARLKL